VSLTFRSLNAPNAQPFSLAAPQCALVRRIFDHSQTIERFDRYLQAVNVSPHTRTAYTFTARKFGEFLGSKSFAAVGKTDVRAFIATLYDRQLAAGTLQNALYALRSLYKFLRLGSQVLTSAPHYVQTRKLPKRLPHAKSEAEIDRLIAAGGSLRSMALLELGYAAGLRVSELSALRCEDVDLKGRSLTVRNGKGGKDRIALFGRKAAAALEMYLDGRKSGPVFVAEPRRQRGGIFRDRTGVWYGQWRETDRKGKRVMRTVRLGDYELPTKERARIALDAYLADKLPAEPIVIPERGLSTKAIWRIVTQAAKRAGLTGVHPHILRHSMGTHCLNRGMDIRHVQELLGHTSLVATQKYLHVATAKLQDVHKRCHPRGGTK
jgi:site-specific recombinase XerD